MGEVNLADFSEVNDKLEKDYSRMMYSHSRISTFEQCPLKFKYAYLDKIKPDFKNSVEAFLGSRVHETLEKLYKDLKFQKLNSIQDLLDYYNSEWEKNWSDDIKIIRKEYDQENYKKMGEEFLKDYYEHYKPFDQSKTLGVEPRIVIKLDDEGKYLLQGFIDRLSAASDGIYEVHDYKTANTLMEQEKADSDRQLALYAIAVKKKYADCKQVKLIWHFLAFDKEIISSRTDEGLEELKSKTIGTIKEIESATEYPAKESALCSWCNYRSKCPKFKHLYEIEAKEEPLFSEDDGVKLVNRYALIKNKEKIVKDKLTEVQEQIYKFAEQKKVDKVYGNDAIVTVWKKECIKFPGKSDPEFNNFVRDLKTAGVWNSFTTLDKWRLEKEFDTLKMDPEAREMIAKHGRKELIKRLYMRERKY